MLTSGWISCCGLLLCRSCLLSISLRRCPCLLLCFGLRFAPRCCSCRFKCLLEFGAPSVACCWRSDCSASSWLCYACTDARASRC
jgi:hypothetical protein